MRPRGGYVHPLKLLRKLWAIVLVGRLLSPQWSRRELPLLFLELVRRGGGRGVLVSLLLLGRELRVGLVLGLVLAVVVFWEGGGEGVHVECGLPGPGGVQGRLLLPLRLGRVGKHALAVRVVALLRPLGLGVLSWEEPILVSHMLRKVGHSRFFAVEKPV
jgi:hypothetical protein